MAETAMRRRVTADHWSQNVKLARASCVRLLFDRNPSSPFRWSHPKTKGNAMQKAVVPLHLRGSQECRCPGARVAENPGNT